MAFAAQRRIRSATRDKRVNLKPVYENLSKCFPASGNEEIKSSKPQKQEKMNKNSTLMVRYIFTLSLILSFIISSQAQVSPNMKFVQPVLLSGTAGQQGAVYKFSNVIEGVDALVTIDKMINGATLVNIDDTTLGYYNAWQPVVGGPGIIGQSSEIRWRIEFKTKSGSTYQVPIFDISAIDIDGDNGRIREYVAVNGQDSYSLPISVPTLMSMSNVPNPNYVVGQDAVMDLKGLGPVANRPGIDTSALDTRVNFKFLNKDIIKISTGAQVDDNGYEGGIATNRFYSMYFKPVSNTIVSVLPVKMLAFDAMAINKNTIDLKWSTATENGTEKYILERSTDGIHFTPLYNVGVARASIGSNYGFRDDISLLSATAVFYKVKIYSYSVLYTESKIVKINLIASAQSHNYIISVVQNGNRVSPVVSYNCVANSFMTLIVADIDGKILYRKQQMVNAGLNAIELPATNLKNRGVKVVQITIQNDNLINKFIYN